MALAAPADLQLAGKSTHPIKGSPGLLLSIADARLSWGARPRQGEGCRAVGAEQREWGHRAHLGEKKGGQGKSLLQELCIYGGGRCGRSHPMCPGTTSPIGVVHAGDGPQGVLRSGARGCRGGHSLAAHPGARGGAGGSRVATRSPSTASPCSVQHPERCRRQLSAAGALRGAQRWPSSGCLLMD